MGPPPAHNRAGTVCHPTVRLRDGSGGRHRPRTGALRSDDGDDPVIVDDALALEPLGPTVGGQLDRRCPSVMPAVRRVTHVEARLAHGQPAVALQGRARHDAATVMGGQDRGAIVDQALEVADTAVDQRTIGEREGEIAREALARRLDRERDALGDEREEVSR